MEPGDDMVEIAEWIKKIIAILVLAGFLEMILPNNELKGATKMMIGLLIILIVMQPLLKVFKLPATILSSVPAVVGADNAGRNLPSTGRIVKEGLAVRAGWTGEIEKRNQEIVIEKIKLSIGLIDKVKLLDTKVEFDNSNLTAIFSHAGLKKVKLRVEFTDSKAGRRNSLAQVQRERQRTGQRIRDTIKLFSNLTDDQIEVIWDG